MTREHELICSLFTYCCSARYAVRVDVGKSGGYEFIITLYHVSQLTAHC